MLTQAQLRAEIYNALQNDALLTDNIYWIDRPTVINDFPIITYAILPLPSEYAFGNGTIERMSETVVFQIDVYVAPGDVATMDAYIERIKTDMETINYRNIGDGGEFVIAEINAISRPTRWERHNV